MTFFPAIFSNAERKALSFKCGAINVSNGDSGGGLRQTTHINVVCVGISSYS